MKMRGRRWVLIAAVIVFIVEVAWVGWSLYTDDVDSVPLKAMYGTAAAAAFVLLVWILPKKLSVPGLRLIPIGVLIGTAAGASHWMGIGHHVPELLAILGLGTLGASYMIMRKARKRLVAGSADQHSWR